MHRATITLADLTSKVLAALIKVISDDTHVVASSRALVVWSRVVRLAAGYVVTVLTAHLGELIPLRTSSGRVLALAVTCGAVSKQC